MSWEKFENIRGPQGKIGPAGSIAGASVTAIDAELPAKVTMTGDTEKHAHFEIPRGAKGDKGDPGVASSASAESIAPSEQAAVILSKEGELVHAHFKIPRGASGTEAVPAAEAVGEYLATESSPVQAGFDSGAAHLVVTDGTALKAAVLGSISAAADPKGSADLVENNSRLRARTRATVEQKRWTDPDGDCDYVVIRTHGGTVSGLVSKHFAHDAEQDLQPGDPLRVTPEFIGAAARRLGKPVVVNASGFDAVSGQIFGAQIKDGVAYGELDSASKSGAESIGFLADGTVKAYSALRGDTTAQMLADGVRDSFGFGPILVEDGVTFDLASSDYWGHGWNVSRSARNILGVDAAGNVILIQVEGRTDEYGLRANSIVDVAVAEGCVTAVALDGGGSVQAEVDGVRAMISTDAGRARAVADLLALNVDVAVGFDSGLWEYTPTLDGLSGRIVARRVGEVVSVKIMLTGAVAEGAQTLMSTPLHRMFRPGLSAERGAVYYQGGYAWTGYVSESGLVGTVIPVGSGVKNNPAGTITFLAAIQS
ncbi:phosphodiester glycosidase family protein [Leucobacter sp. HY1908]